MRLVDCRHLLHPACLYTLIDRAVLNPDPATYKLHIMLDCLQCPKYWNVDLAEVQESSLQTGERRGFRSSKLKICVQSST